MSIRQLLHEFRPLFRMLEDPITRSPASFMLRTRPFFDDPFFTMPMISRPAVDISEDGNKYIVEADLPGVKKENVEVRIGDGGHSITIQGKTFSKPTETSESSSTTSEPQKNSDAPDEGSIIKSEKSNQLSTERQLFSNASFTRTVWLPQPVNGSGVAAKLTDGVLTITIPKAEDKGSVVVPVE
ncbi:heat shock protein hsp20 [Moniliophthora roreri MCA 2997]|uniref:Heat shock protein hsp20 n=2 Tax=Moniliophthora roreri TaxID=221103 RepID=V2XR37_MONRO|nr:heat shock protein hsp20 [Moniliophthora roreri MCA 2997]KAI3607841.1 heat shock protein hsp20 [Moniliophthora roreri]